MTANFSVVLIIFTEITYYQVCVEWDVKLYLFTDNFYSKLWLKLGFHYPSWRPELIARVDGWPVSITRQHGLCWRVMETGHPSTWVVETGL